jgi:hypothetical protein
LALGTTIIGLSIAQYDFMRSLRWHPLDAPTTDWPSGLALGPYGALMIAAFLGSGALIVIFAIGLEQHLAPGAGRRIGPLLVGAAGVAMMLLAAPTDPTYVPTPRTVAGAVHDMAFVLLGITLLPALLILPLRMRQSPTWHAHATYTWATAAVLIPTFLLRGLAFYIFLGAILLWFGITGRKLLHTTATQ